MNYVAHAGTNLPRMGDFNSLVILEQIRRSMAGVSRVEIAKSSGLSAQTVSNQATKLIEAGLIVEGEKVPLVRGKPRTLLNLNPQAGYVVGVHVDPSLISFVLTDMAVVILERSSFPMPATIEELCELIQREVARLVADLPEEKVLGVGLATPGPVDMESGVIVDPPNLKGWERVYLRDLVAELTGLPTFIQKDSIAALAGELWFRNRSLSGSTLFVYLGFGLGFAFAYRGELNQGAGGNSGEVGHFRVGSGDAMCPLGHRGCLPSMVAPLAVVQQAIEAGILPDDIDVDDHLAVEECVGRVARAAEAGNDQAKIILMEKSAQLAEGILVAVDLIDASDVVFGGHNRSLYQPYLEQQFLELFAQRGASRRVHSVEWHTADFEDWGVAVGAACLVLDSMFSPRTSVLSSSGEKTAP